MQQVSSAQFAARQPSSPPHTGRTFAGQHGGPHIRGGCRRRHLSKGSQQVQLRQGGADEAPHVGEGCRHTHNLRPCRHYAQFNGWRPISPPMLAIA
jgi:hypothetical protein